MSPTRVAQFSCEKMPANGSRGMPLQVTNFAVIGVLGAAGQLLTAMAYRYGSAPLVAPVGYASIGVAVLIGWWRFGDQPDLMRLIGIALIAACGVLVVLSRANVSSFRPVGHQEARRG